MRASRNLISLDGGRGSAGMCVVTKVVTLSCPPPQYGTVRKYSFSSVVQSRLAGNGSTRATLLVRCLHQVTWGIDQQQQDKLNGQKYLVYISDLHTDATESAEQR